MYMIAEVSQYVAVASFAEAWIEIVILKQLFPRAPSPPSRRRGLKFFPERAEVAAQRRLLRGGVD